MGKDFFTYWFKGFERSLENMDEENRNIVFEQCGKACSDSHTKQVYMDEYSRSEGVGDFLFRLKKRFPEIDFKITEENRCVELTYRYCACDLVTSGYVKTPLLCECSRQSLLHNWESVLGKNQVKVEILSSILGGNDCCKFRIHILRQAAE